MKKISIIILLALAVTTGCGHTDLTFVAISDCHVIQTDESTANNYAMVNHLNSLPGTTYPSYAGGGKVSDIRGVIIPGDLVEGDSQKGWMIFNEIYSPTGNGLVKFPVYEGLGNHDIAGTKNDPAPWKNCYQFIQIVHRTKERPNIVMTDPTGLHYSWDWGDVHFVQLNLYIGETGVPRKYDDPWRSYSFLEQDLARNVGNSGRPVIVAFHYGWTDRGKWPLEEAKKATTLLEKYNCIGAIHGHWNHNKGPLKYKFEGLDIYNDGGVKAESMLVFRITNGKMYVIARIKNNWAGLIDSKDINMGTPKEEKSIAANDTIAPGKKFLLTSKSQ